MAEITPAAKVQRWDPAEIVRALLAEEAAAAPRPTSEPAAPALPSPPGRPSISGTRKRPRSRFPRSPALRTLEWVGRRENLWVGGPSGTGKSHFCEALGQSAVDAGMTIAWFTVEDLLSLIRRLLVDDSVSKGVIGSREPT